MMKQEIKEVPKAERLEVYKKALEIVKDFKGEYEMREPQLCLLLPCIYFNLDTFHKLRFRCSKTKILFPELECFLIKGFWIKHTNEERIAFLTETIKKLES